MTPRQENERQSNWTTFRIRHNRAEGNRDVRLVAARSDLRLGDAKAACVQDSYTTSTDARYMEIACLIDGRAPSVIVAAAPPARWHMQSPTLEGAISAAAAGVGAGSLRAGGSAAQR